MEKVSSVHKFNYSHNKHKGELTFQITKQDYCILSFSPAFVYIISHLPLLQSSYFKFKSPNKITVLSASHQPFFIISLTSLYYNHQISNHQNIMQGCSDQCSATQQLNITIIPNKLILILIINNKTVSTPTCYCHD
jgi:hypothetical protein